MAATYSDVVIKHVDLYGSVHMHCVVIHRWTQIELAACSIALPSVDSHAKVYGDRIVPKEPLRQGGQFLYLYVYDVIVKSSRSLSHLLMSLLLIK